ncbi:MarR family transcriptional regulator [Nocardia sp. NBC_00881]|uniref:MarR family winged helix-turn-helix transcriptional regulator n=1 Tax=Nocardia sp. NBC_00881 TaxID=2975995 RepID=UPI003867323A|nr:MarR family transcriptional regulator [Nocardia sp. NBC_00881]
MSCVTERANLSDGDVHNVAATLRGLVWSLRRFGERQSGLVPLPNSEFEVLRTVAESPGCTVSDIARHLGLQASNVSTTVRNLMKRGLLVREVDPSDRRSGRLRLSSEAQRHSALIEDAWERAINTQLRLMSADEVSTIVAAAPLLRRLSGMAEDSYGVIGSAGRNSKSNAR